VQRCEAQAQASRRSVKCLQIVAGPPSCDPGPNAMNPRSSLLTQQPGMLYGTYAKGIHKAADANTRIRCSRGSLELAKLAPWALWLDRILR
jgi:hypothetical protein